MQPRRLQSSPITNYFKTFVKKENSNSSAVRKPLSDRNISPHGMTPSRRRAPQTTSILIHKGVDRKGYVKPPGKSATIELTPDTDADLKPSIVKKPKYFQDQKMLKRCPEVIMIRDSPVIDLTDPSPKRLCLIDLTESPVLVDLGAPESQRVAPAVGNELTVTVDGKTKDLNNNQRLQRLSFLLDEAFETLPSESTQERTPTDLTVSIALSDLGRRVKSLKLTSPVQGQTLGDSPIDDLFDCCGQPLESDLELLLWERGVPYTKEPSLFTVRPFTKTQHCIIENMMENGSSSSSTKLHAILSYLRISTTALLIPRASCLHRLWKMATDLQVTADQGSLRESISYIRSLLSYHTPGQHPAVDTVYSEFVSLLGPGGGASFAAWEEISRLTCGPEHYGHLLSFIVDLFLSDFWRCLLRHRECTPLFVKVFWKSPAHHHVTGAVRRLVDMTMNCWENNQIELSRLESLMSLVFLVNTWCSDLETELLIASRKLPAHYQTLFLTYIRPSALRSKLARELPAVHETYTWLVNTAQQLPPSPKLTSRQVRTGQELHSPKPTSPRSNCSPPPSQSDRVSHLDYILPLPSEIPAPRSFSQTRPLLSYCQLNVPKAQCTAALKKFLSAKYRVKSQQGLLACENCGMGSCCCREITHCSV